MIAGIRAQVSFTAASGQVVPVRCVDNMDGTFMCSFDAPLPPDAYHLAVLLVAACARTCTR